MGEEEKDFAVENLMWEDAEIAMSVLYARARAFTIAFEEYEGRGHDCAEIGDNAHSLAHAASRYTEAVERAVAFVEGPV